MSGMLRAFAFIAVWVLGSPAFAQVKMCGVEFEKIVAPDGAVLDGRTISGERMVRRITNQICPRIKAGGLWDRYVHLTFSDDAGSFFAYNIGHDFIIPFHQLNDDAMTKARFQIAQTELPSVYLEKVDAEGIRDTEAQLIRLFAAQRPVEEAFAEIYWLAPWVGRSNTWTSGYTVYNSTTMLDVLVGGPNYKDFEAGGMSWRASPVAPYDYSAAYERVMGKKLNAQ